MDDYDCIKTTSLKFKGEKRKKKSKGVKHDAKPTVQPDEQEAEISKDARKHGGWRKIDKYDQIKQDVAIEILPYCYLRAMTNGTIMLGDAHPQGEGPDEEEIFTVVSLGAGKIALKSGFGRYLEVDKTNHLIGLSEVISEQQTFSVIFEDDTPALRSITGCYLSLEEDSEGHDIVGSDERRDVFIRAFHDFDTSINKRESNKSKY